VRFGLNPKGKTSLQQDSQYTGRQTCPNLYPASPDVTSVQSPQFGKKKWLRESIKKINKVKYGLEKLERGKTTHFVIHKMQNSQILFPQQNM